MASSNLLSHTRYQQGEWFGVVRNGTIVLLGPETPHALIDAVWGLLESSPEAHEVLNEVTGAFGVSLSRIPPFGIIDSKDALRVFLRGDLELAVHLDGRQEHLTGRDVTTWTERRIVGATSFNVYIGAPAAEGIDRPLLDTLPVKDGVVLLASLEAAGSAPAAAGPVPEAQLVPEVRLEQDAHVVPRANLAAVSDETMIGYQEADLGLTIAPGQAHAIDEPVPAAPHAKPVQDTGHGDTVHAGPEPANGEHPLEEPAAAGLEGPAGSASLGSVPDEPEHGEAEKGEADARPGDDGPPAPDRNGEDGSVDASDVPVHTSTTDPVSHSLENTTNYDHLWDKTVMRTIEDAAVRLQSDSDDHDTPAGQALGPQPPSAPQPPSETEATGPEATGPEPTGAEPTGPEALAPQPLVIPPMQPSAPPAGQSASAAPAGGLIDSVPWLRSSAPSPLAAPAPQVPAAWAPAPSSSPVDEDSDHDGQTIMKSSLPPADDVDAAATPGATPAVNGPSVLARVCSQGHANPPTYPLCSVCGVAISGDAVHVPRPRLGRMRLSTGELIDLDQSLIIGRQPSVSRVQGGTMPRLVQVESPGGDISRSHVEVRLEGWHVMLCDLKATNGTVLIREGQAPRRLAQNEMAILLDGDIAELGDDISLRFEEIL
ncbi:hypothetical protein [Paenarthrobacter histidinolovorans]|uniref:hypothetical protein n=1 Tax=Paenarthrobacter histidinolovorans TaxID=43664 RepID=UPI001668F2C1|nr:hypothetical protein [Paenarthrobacter histidinolovorans]GGJ15820.1 hypothetical protein GCM10010052_11500 [Paenarthrobacter histidinolovorans]